MPMHPIIKHSWPENYKDAVSLQEKLRARLILRNETGVVRLVAGADVSYSKGSDTYYAAIVVLAYPEMEVVEEAWASGRAKFPYIPGLLSFREGPITLAALSKLKHRPDVIMYDGQGIAHPRGFGLASHMGVLTGIPSIGCAKSVLVGEFDEPGISRGSRSPLVHKGEAVGCALRTRDGVKPVFVSVGHRVDLETAARIVLECAKGYRLPETTRRAHLLVNRVRKIEESTEALTPNPPSGDPSPPTPSPARRGGLIKAAEVEEAPPAPLPPSPAGGEGEEYKPLASRNLPPPARGRAGVGVGSWRGGLIKNSATPDLMSIYDSLYAHYGPQRWWPGETPFEVMVGAILTQNTNWGNVEKAIANLKGANALSAEAVHSMPDEELAALIRPSGYFNIKARRLKSFISYFMDNYGGDIGRMKKTDCATLREEVLAVNGVGPETADSILLYALGCPTFVVDAYTKRIFSRHGFFPETADYHDVRKFFMDSLPADVRIYNEYHALIVRLAKDRCIKKAGNCALCLLAAEMRG